MRELPAHSSTPSGLLRSDDSIERPAVNIPTRGSRPAILDAQPTIAMLLASLRRKWLLAAILGSIAAAVSGVAVYRTMPPARHIARAMLHVAATQPNIIFNTKEIRSNFDIYKQTQLRLLKGRSVLGAVLRDPMVKNLDLVKEASKEGDPIAWLEREIQADYTGELLNISMAGNGPEGLATLVNAVAESYLVEVVNAEAKERRKRFDKLQKLYSDYTDRLTAKRKELEQLAGKLGSSDQLNVRLTHALALENRSIIEQQLRRIRMELREAEIELAVQRESDRAFAGKSSENAELIEEAVRNDPVVIDFQTRIRRVNATIAKASRLARNKDDPAVRHPQEELKNLTLQLRARESAIRQARARVFQDAGEDGSSNPTKNLENRIKVLKQTERLTAADLEGVSTEAGVINESSMSLEKLQTEIASVERSTQKIGDEVESLNVELEAPSRVHLIEPADTPLLSGDKRLKSAALASVAALALLVGGITYADFLTRRVWSVDEVVLGLGLRLIGTLPPLPKRKTNLASKPDAGRPPLWHAELIEAVDTLRTNLLNSASTRRTRTLVVTSAVSGEGKTSLACHLATSIARAGRKTLLIDGDLRCSDVHKIFDLTTCPGLSEVIRGEVEVGPSIHPTAFPDLWVLTAGLCDEMALRALAQNKFRDLLGRLKREFDFIVIDTPPVLPVADASLIAEQADAYVQAVLGGASRLPQVYTAHERLQNLGIPTFGVVVAGVRGINYAGKYNYHQGRVAPVPRPEAG